MKLRGGDVLADGGEGHVPERRLQEGQVVLGVLGGEQAAGLPLPQPLQDVLRAPLLGPVVGVLLGKAVRVGRVGGLGQLLVGVGDQTSSPLRFRPIRRVKSASASCTTS